VVIPSYGGELAAGRYRPAVKPSSFGSTQCSGWAGHEASRRRSCVGGRSCGHRQQRRPQIHGRILHISDGGRAAAPTSGRPPVTALGSLAMRPRCPNGDPSPRVEPRGFGVRHGLASVAPAVLPGCVELTVTLGAMRSHRRSCILASARLPPGAIHTATPGEADACARAVDLGRTGLGRCASDRARRIVSTLRRATIPRRREAASLADPATVGVLAGVRLRPARRGDRCRPAPART
jgi:hypothetical protein